eukprot:1985247-Rhodomonas_salina.3
MGLPGGRCSGTRVSESHSRALSDQADGAGDVTVQPRQVVRCVTGQHSSALLLVQENLTRSPSPGNSFRCSTLPHTRTAHAWRQLPLLRQCRSLYKVLTGYDHAPFHFVCAKSFAPSAQSVIPG